MEEVIAADGTRLVVNSTGIVLALAESSKPLKPPSKGVDPAANIDPAQVEQCLRWFQRAERADDAGVNSFWLKHFIEHWAGTFVSNGAVIVAAHRLGFPILRDPEETTPNVRIGVARHCIDEFDCGCGHP